MATKSFKISTGNCKKLIGRNVESTELIELDKF